MGECEFFLAVKEEFLTRASFLEGVERMFSIDASDFHSTGTPGVVVARGCGSTTQGGLWNGGLFEPGIEYCVEPVVEDCEDGSFVEFLNERGGVWETCFAEDGNVAWGWAAVRDGHRAERPDGWERWAA